MAKMSLYNTTGSKSIDPSDRAEKPDLLYSSQGGLLIGLLVALVTVAIAAAGAGLTVPNVLTGTVSSSATPTAVIVALPTPVTPLSTVSTPFPTPIPTSLSFSPSPTVMPVSTLTPTHSPTLTPMLFLSPTAEISQVIGHSVQGRPLQAYRIGQGPIKVVLVGDIHGGFEANTHVLAQQLLEYFETHPGQVPANVSLWIIPTMNPDGLKTEHRWNANDVDLNRNADTDLDGCAGNDWSPDTVGLEGTHPGAGGAYPFSEPEARAVRDFLDDAWIAIFYHSAAESIFVDTCQRHSPTARLADILSAGTGYPVPEEGWAGYRITGDFGDYLAGEGVAAVIVELTDHQDPEFERNLAGVQALLGTVDEILSVEAETAGAEYVWLSEDNTGVWRYAEGSFVHPLALEMLGNTAYLLDAGRVLALALDRVAPPTVLLAPGAEIDGVRVLEPFDMAADRTSGADGLLVLDRAGDVYRYDPVAGAWTVERYDRLVRDTYDHYFVALAGGEQANYLLETTHEQVWRFAGGSQGVVWAQVPKGRDVDVSAGRDGIYVLTRSLNGPVGSLLHYREAQQVSGFQPNVDIMHPRQVLASDAAVYVLDRAGRRLLSLDPGSGALQALYQFTDRRDVSVVWADPFAERLVLAGRDALYFYGEPDRLATVEGGVLLEGPQPHDMVLLAGLCGYQMPIEGASITSRDFQMPGAPRHYRLGVHEGMDFYGHTVGVPVNLHTPVRAVADGVVVRALVDYQPLTAAQADAWYAASHEAGYTPPEVLDGYRGRQVWIDHGGGVISRYAHLGSIAEGIVEGVAVTQGQVIATVGNSGTPGSLQSQTYDVHLHMELWVNDHFIGQFLRPIEAREWLGKILR
jgi:murein DD-endopeptidase MepM/ murein hydrolase activator NlpD